MAAVRELVDEGLREAAAISHPVLRVRHRYAWAFRLSAVDAPAAALLLPELGADPEARADLLLAVARDSVRAGGDPGPLVEQALAKSGAGEAPEARLALLNGLSETAIELGDRDPEAARALLRRLAPAARGLGADDPEAGCPSGVPRLLATALVGEALLLLEDPLGRELLDEAAAASEGLPARDAVLQFIAGAVAPDDPERALALTAAITEPAAQVEAWLHLLGRLSDAAARERALDAVLVHPLLPQVEASGRGAELYARLAQAAAETLPERAHGLGEQAAARARAAAPEVRSLQLTGVATALVGTDRETAGALFREAAAAAEEDPSEPVRRVTALVVAANEMAASHPREAAAVFARAMELAAELDAMWELAHALEVVFQPERSPYLAVEGALPVLERALARMADDDPRIPGVFGLPEVARYLAQVDPERALEAYRRWLRSAEAGYDSEGVTQAAVAMYRMDPEAGLPALERARDLLLERVDCLSLGEFCRQVAPVVPGMVPDVAPRIPDPGERAQALAAAAAHLFPSEPERALALVRSLPRAADRSSALLGVVDRLLGTSDRPRPQPLLEDLP